MDKVLLKLAAEADQKRAAVLCVITETSGSSPRKAGAKLLLTADHTTFGTVGGGSLELRTIAIAEEVMKHGRTCLVKLLLEDDLSMGCGGEVSVYFEKFSSGTPLIIFGGGHVGKALAELAPDYGFDTKVVDPRLGIFNGWQKKNITFFETDYVESIAALSLSCESYAVVMTPEHLQDEILLQALLPLDLSYLGMMGSKRKVEQIRKKLLASGIFTTDQIDSIHMPVGIRMQCETPAEIALSILAEMIDVRNAFLKQ